MGELYFNMVSKKKGQLDLLNVIFGLVVIVGGVVITFGMVNLGSWIATMGLLLELTKLLAQKGA